jgi:hypothetical protein
MLLNMVIPMVLLKDTITKSKSLNAYLTVSRTSIDLEIEFYTFAIKKNLLDKTCPEH